MGWWLASLAAALTIDEAQLTQWAGEIGPRVEAHAGRVFLELPDVRITDQAGVMRRIVADRVPELMDQGLDRAEAEALVVEDRADFVAASIGVYVSADFTYYLIKDAVEGVLSIFPGDAEREGAIKCLMAHELTHALQHQYMRGPVDDRGTMFREGHAALVEHRVCSELAPSLTPRIMDAVQGTDVLSSSFPHSPTARLYGGGRLAVADLERREGVDGVWAAFDDPPDAATLGEWAVPYLDLSWSDPQPLREALELTSPFRGGDAVWVEEGWRSAPSMVLGPQHIDQTPAMRALQVAHVKLDSGFVRVHVGELQSLEGYGRYRDHLAARARGAATVTPWRAGEPGLVRNGVLDEAVRYDWGSEGELDVLRSGDRVIVVITDGLRFRPRERRTLIEALLASYGTGDDRSRELLNGSTVEAPAASPGDPRWAMARAYAHLERNEVHACSERAAQGLAWSDEPALRAVLVRTSMECLDLQPGPTDAMWAVVETVEDQALGSEAVEIAVHAFASAGEWARVDALILRAGLPATPLFLASEAADAQGDTERARRYARMGCRETLDADVLASCEAEGLRR